MGMFAWLDVNLKENITLNDDKVTLLIPKEHRGTVEMAFNISLTDRGIEGRYDGYGHVWDIDVYDICAYLNVICTTDEQYRDVVFRNKMSPNIKELADNIRNHYAGNFIGRDALKTIDDIYRFCGNKDKFREIGIDIVCGNRLNAFLPYPVKLTVSKDYTYENSNFSMYDTEQGFYKYTVDNRKYKKLLIKAKKDQDIILKEMEETKSGKH